MQRGDAHLGHHLQHALADALAVGGNHVLVAVDVGGVVEVALLAGVPEGFKGEIGVDGVRTVADQQAVVVNLPRLAGLDNDADPGAFVLGHQMVMHRAHRQQGADRSPLGVHGAIRQHDEAVAAGDGLARLGADAIKRRLKARLAAAGREADVDGGAAPSPVVQVLNGGQFVVG